jgi:hypothetical protein
MKLFVHYSPGILPLYTNFCRSVWEKTTFNLIAALVPEEFSGCVFGEDRYWAMIKWLAADRLRIIRERVGELIIFAGCDAEFYGNAAKDIEARMGDLDFLTPDDGDGRCTGCLQAVRCDAKTIAMYEQVVKFSENQRDDFCLDKWRKTVAWGMLSRNLYWNLAGVYEWEEGKPVADPPKEILWFHANWCRGMKNKLFLLNMVRAKLQGEKANGK